MAFDLVDLAMHPELPLTQEEYFTAKYLKVFFNSKISRSQASGKDGIRVGIFRDSIDDETAIIERKVKELSYKFTTFKERLILKGAGKAPRQISIPTVRDRLTLRALCELIHRSVPRSIGPTPHAVVSGVVDALTNCTEPSSFIRIDVQNFFPSIAHDQLSKELLKYGVGSVAHDLCMKAVQTPTGSNDTPNSKGVPQGLSISGGLSQIYMLPFDDLQKTRNGRYFRYVDDILLIAPESQVENEFKRVRRALSRRGLKTHPLGSEGKTEIKPITEGVDFLGYHICKDKKIAIRESSYRRMFKNLMKVLTDYRYRKDINRSIFQINLKITGCIVDKKRRGWTMFFSRTEDLSQLRFLDEFLKNKLIEYNFSETQKMEIKTFIKSYHEIRYNILSTKYIPNFDNFSQFEKIDAISRLTRKSLEEISSWSVEYIENEFSRLISREVHDLEQDVGGIS